MPHTLALAPPAATRPTRTTLRRAVYQNPDGTVDAIARIGQQRKEKRFPKGTADKAIDAWLEQERSRMRGVTRRVVRARGTFAGEVVAYLATLSAYDRYHRTSLLQAWVVVLGETRRARWTIDGLRRIVAGWVDAGVAAATITHRRRALAQMVDALDGPANNLVRQLKRPRGVLGALKSWPMDALTALIDGMDGSAIRLGRGESSASARGGSNLSQARLRLLLWTGMPVGSVKQLAPRRVMTDVERGELWYPPRQKGHGAPGVLLKLFPEGRRAVDAWIRARAWGTCSTGSLGKALTRAATAYAAREAAAGRLSPVDPAEITPHHLRHSFLTWIAVTTNNPYTVQLYGQHQDLETTYRYMRAAVPQLAEDAVARAYAQIAR